MKQPEKLWNAGHEIHIHMVDHPWNFTGLVACLQLLIYIHCTTHWQITISGTAETLSSYCFHCLKFLLKSEDCFTNRQTYKHTYIQTALPTYPCIYLLPTHPPTTYLPPFLPHSHTHWLYGAEFFLKANNSLAGHKIPHILCNPNLHYHVHKSMLWAPILNNCFTDTDKDTKQKVSINLMSQKHSLK